jgi:outer membrane protein assembly factor BamA
MKRFVALAALSIGSLASAQSVSRGREVSALPATNFSSDEGFGYGVTAQFFQYGDGTIKPYVYTVQPLIFFTTKGRRDFSVFVDAPGLLPANWRMGLYAGREQQLATPYYGPGNSSGYDQAAEQQNKYYYRYGRRGVRLAADFQHAITGPLRVLAGANYRTLTFDTTPFDSATLLNSQIPVNGLPAGRMAGARTGLVYDTRDRETGPTRGMWVELLGQQQSGTAFHESQSFARFTGTTRAYVPVGDRLVWAQRGVAQHVEGNEPFYEMPTIQGSFHDSEGLGGSGTVRGLPQNRYIGKGLVFFNEELRYRAADFFLHHRASAVILSGFFDGGRVWERGLFDHEGDSGLHYGYGGGARLRFGEDFVVALDVAHSRDGTPIYIGLGYPF